jgi:colanic acid biosynthesis glycosyl transferase WcaI
VKILLYGINFAPELTGVGKYTAEMAAWLAREGHEVRVVTAPPSYPDWAVQQGYSARRYDKSAWQGVSVVRCPLWVPRVPTAARRLLHLLSFAVSSAPAVLAQLRWKPDVVWVVEPTFFCAPMALLAGALSRACTVLHVQDFELDAAFKMGLLKGAWLLRAVARLELAVLRRFDVVSTISGKMIERLQAKGVQPERLHFCPNWVDVGVMKTGAGSQRFRQLLGLPPDAVVALYSGNMAQKQGLELLAEVAAALVGEPRLHFVFCGNGTGRAGLQLACRGLANVSFLDLQPVELLPELLATADIHLLPQRADASDLVMPSKLCGMLASGKPVVATALAGSELEAITRQCGVVVPPGDGRAAAAAVLRLVHDPALAARLGSQGAAYASRDLDQDVILQRYVALFRAAMPAEPSKCRT